jgi:hypothetical protein
MANLRPDLFGVFQRYQRCWLGGVKHIFAFIGEFHCCLRDRLFDMGRIMVEVKVLKNIRLKDLWS